MVKPKSPSNFRHVRGSTANTVFLMAVMFLSGLVVTELRLSSSIIFYPQETSTTTSRSDGSHGGDMPVIAPSLRASRGLPSPISEEQMLTRAHRARMSVRPHISAFYGQDDDNITSTTRLHVHHKHNFLPLNTTWPRDHVFTADELQNRIIYLITPTHYRRTQMVDMTRVSQMVQLAHHQYNAHFYWIVVEDGPSCTQRVRDILEESKIPFAHLSIATDHSKTKHKGLEQRNLGLDLISTTLRKEGVVYFMDDDNAYHVQLFSELLQTTRRVSVGAVALPSPSLYERCHVNATTGKVDALLSGWSVQPRRPFGIDMAGFGFTTSILAQRQPRFLMDSEKGFLEHDFLIQATDGGDFSEMDPMGGNCTKFLAWHVRTSVGMEPRQYKVPERTQDGGGYILLGQLA